LIYVKCINEKLFSLLQKMLYVVSRGQCEFKRKSTLAFLHEFIAYIQKFRAN